jgi:hypothetical protein
VTANSFAANYIIREGETRMISKKEIIGKGKKILAVSLSSVMIATLAPEFVGGALEVRADFENVKTASNTTYGISRIEKTDKTILGKWNYVWFGRNQNGNPLKCRILSTDAINDTGDEYRIMDDSMKTHKMMFLDSEIDAGQAPFESNYTNFGTKLYNVWTNEFDSREKVLVPLMQAEKKYNGDLISRSCYDQVVHNENLILLGKADLTNNKLGYNSSLDNAEGKGKDSDSWTRCWLSELGNNNRGKYALYMTTNGKMHYDDSTYLKNIYPAFFVDTTKILFTTTVKYSSSSKYDAEFKLTVYDNNMKIEVPDGKEAYQYSSPYSDVIAVPYTISGTNSNKVEQVSVFILDSSNKIKYYNKLNTGTIGTSGVGTFTLPNGISASQIGTGKTYKLYLIAEDINDEQSTDFASPTFEIERIGDIKYYGEGKTDSIIIKDGAFADSKLTILEPDNLMYDGKAKIAKTNDYDKKIFVGDCEIKYYRDDVNPGNIIDKSEVVDPGDYAAELVFKDKENNSHSAKVLFTILTGYAYEVKSPSAKTLTENGSAQELINAGQSQNGTMLYALGNSSVTAPSATTFKTNIPTAKNAGTYYVWYLTKGDEHYNGIPANCITVKVNKAKNENSGSDGGSTNKEDKNKSGDNSGTKEDKNNSGENSGTKEDKNNSGNNNSNNNNANAPKSVGTPIANKSASFVVTSSDAKNPTVKYTATKKTTSTSVTIPNTVTFNNVKYKITEVSPRAFKKNKKIKTVKIGKYVTKIGNEAFSGCTSLTTVTGGPAVKTIGTGAFNGCKKLKKAPIGSKVTSIGAKAFYDCASLTAMTLPAKTSKLGKQFAGNCKKLRKLTVKSTKMTNKSVAAEAFKDFGSKYKVTVNVPKGKKASYKKLFKSKGAGTKVTYKESK